VSLLPGEILPPSEPIGTTADGQPVQLSKLWWLLFYNVVKNSIGAGIPDEAIEVFSSNELDASYPEQVREVDTSRELLDVFVLTPVSTDTDVVLPDVPAQAQPAKSITPGASPYVYTAAFDGTVAVTGGTVSAITITRQGTSVATGITTGLIPLSRLDQLQVTYSVAPTMTFLPR
jgi:hypothetical protein